MPTILIKGTQTTKRVRLDNGQTTYFNDLGQADTWNEVRPVRVRKRRPPNWLEPTGYNFHTHTTRAPIGEYRTLQGSYLYTLSGVLWTLNKNLSEHTYLPLTGQKSTAEIKALLALKDQHVNLGVAFAEAQQTANLIGTTASRIGRAYNSFKRGKYRQGIRQLAGGTRNSNADIPRSWLEAQYAWKPLLSDVYGATEALASQPRTNWTMTGKGSVSDTDHQVVEYKHGDAYVISDITRLSGTYVRLDYLPGNTLLDTLSRVGMTNPLEVVWEKVPFSFVVDWFLPIGNWLSAMDATIGWEFRAGSCSQLRRMKSKITAAAPRDAYLGGRFSGSMRSVDLDRQVYLSSPLPYPPRPKNPLSLGHMANGLSLLATAFGSR